MGFLTTILGKLAGTAVGGFVTSNLWVIVLAAFVGLGGLTGWYKYTSVRNDGRANLAEEKYNNLHGTFEQLAITNDLNEEAYQECLNVNQQNAIDLAETERIKQEQRNQIMLLQQASEHTRQDIRDDGEELRGRDTECRTADAALPEWIVSGLCDLYPEGCSRTPD